MTILLLLPSLITYNFLYTCCTTIRLQLGVVLDNCISFSSTKRRVWGNFAATHGPNPNRVCAAHWPCFYQDYTPTGKKYQNYCILLYSFEYSTKNQDNSILATLILQNMTFVKQAISRNPGLTIYHIAKGSQFSKFLCKGIALVARSLYSKSINQLYIYD
jgi:hypothetical protein